MMEPQYDLYIITYIPTGWSGSFKIPLAIPHNVKSDSFYVKYSTQGWMDTWDMPKKGASDPDAKGIFYELDSTAGEYVTISSTNYKGAFINEIHIKLYPVRRSYYLPFTQSDKAITLLDGLYVSPSFATQAEALSWAETNYPTDIADFELKKSAWTLLYDKDAISLRQGTSKPLQRLITQRPGQGRLGERTHAQRQRRMRRTTPRMAELLHTHNQRAQQHKPQSTTRLQYPPHRQQRQRQRQPPSTPTRR